MPDAPDIRSKQPGDMVYPDYSRILTLDTNVAVTKGKLYTMQYLISAAGARGKVSQFGATANANTIKHKEISSATYGSFENGIVQPMLTLTSKDRDAGRTKVSCLMHGSRILVKGAAGITHGSLLRYNVGDNQVEKHAFASGNGANTGEQMSMLIGRAWAVYSGDNIETEKKVSAAGDNIIVDVGMR